MRRRDRLEEQPDEHDDQETSDDGTNPTERLRKELSKPPQTPRDDRPSSAVAGSKSAYPFMGRFSAMEMLGLNRVIEDMRRTAMNPFVQMQLDTIGMFARQSITPIPKWESPVAGVYQRQIEEMRHALFPRTSMLPDSTFPWLKNSGVTPTWMPTFDALTRGVLGSQSVTPPRTRRTADEDFLSEADTLLDSTDEDESDEVFPRTILDAILEDLESSLSEDGEDDSDVIPEALEDSSEMSDLTPLRALYRLVVNLHPDIRDDPRMHRILRRAAGGSLVATMLLLWFLNPALFVVLMNVGGVFPIYAVGTAAVDRTLARGEKPRSSDNSSEEPEDDPEESSDVCD